MTCVLHKSYTTVSKQCIIQEGTPPDKIESPKLLSMGKSLVGTRERVEQQFKGEPIRMTRSSTHT